MLLAFAKTTPYSEIVDFIVRCHLGCYLYAAYGSNLHPVRLKKRVPSAALIGKSFLPNYSLKFHKKSNQDGSAKCNIVVGESGVHVAVFKIDEIDRMALDRIEGVGTGYDHKEIPLEDFGTCSIYVASSNSIDDSLFPMDWYKEYVVRGAQYNAFPDDYISMLQVIKAVPDSDLIRASREWELINTFNVAMQERA